MIIDYSKLILQLARKCMRLADLKMSSVTMQRLRDEKPIRTTTAGKIAKQLDCDIGDLVKGAE